MQINGMIKRNTKPKQKNVEKLKVFLKKLKIK